MAPSGGGGGDATRGDDAAHDDDGKWNKGQTPISPSPVKPSPSDLRQPTSTKGLSGGHDKDGKDGKLNDDSAPHNYPDSFQGFSELPFNPAVSQAAIADEELVPPYPNVFEGFAELPANDGESNEKLGCEDAHNELGSPELAIFEGFSELPVNVKELQDKDNDSIATCEDAPPFIEAKIARTKSLKRSIVDEDKSMIESPKRSRFGSFADLLSELSYEVKAAAGKDDNTISDVQNDATEISSETIVIAHSPVERFRFLNAFRLLAQQHNKRAASMDQRVVAAMDQRLASMDQREATMDKREVSLDKREVSLDKREDSVDKRELLVDSAEALLLKAKSDNDPETPAKESSISQNIEKGKGLMEKAGSYVKLVDDIVNIPTKSEEMVHSYKKNKETAGEYIKKQHKVGGKKIKGYAGTITTAGFAKEMLIRTLKAMLTGWEASEAEPADSASEASEAEPADSASEASEAESADAASEAEAADAATTPAVVASDSPTK